MGKTIQGDITMKHLEPMTGEDYNQHWNYTDFTDKVILDLGADYGSTAFWFLEHGAKEVIAVEMDDTYYAQLKKNTDDKVHPCHMAVTKGDDYNHLIEVWKPDICKIDIEGYEASLLDAVPEQIRKVPEYLIETHNADLFCSLATMFVELGYEVKFVCHTTTFPLFGKEFSVDVLYAKCIKE